MNRRLRLGYVSPLPPDRTGIADYSAELLPGLDRLADLTVYVENPQHVEASLRRRFHLRPIAALPANRWRHDGVVFQMGNNPLCHEAMYRVFQHYPGVLVLHDHVLHHLIVGCTVAEGDLCGYQREMGYVLGVEGYRRAKESADGAIPYPWFEVPLSDRLIDLSLGVIVHSRYVERLVRKGRDRVRTAVISQPIDTSISPRSRRHLLPWPRDAIIFACVGQVTPSKKVDMALRAFARLHAVYPRTFFLVVGEWRKDVLDVPGLVAELGLTRAVKCLGHVESLRQFEDWTATADIVVNLRYPTVGETSATALRALAAGCAVIVNNDGWYAELPDDTCLKIAANSEEALLAAMERLVQDADLRQRLGERGRTYVQQQHAVDVVALQYIDFIARLEPSSPVRPVHALSVSTCAGAKV